MLDIFLNLRLETWTQWTIEAALVKVHHRRYSFEDGPLVYPANAFDSRLRGDYLPLGSSPTKSQKKDVCVYKRLRKEFSGWRHAIAFLYLFLFHSLLRLTSFLSQYKKENFLWSTGKWLLRSASSVSRSEWTLLYELSTRVTYCWTSFIISDWKLGPSGRSRQCWWRFIIGHTLLRMVRWCIRLTRLTLVYEVIRYRLVQVWQNLKKKDSPYWRPAIAFLYLFLFHSFLRLTSFLSQYKKENFLWATGFNGFFSRRPRWAGAYEPRCTSSRAGLLTVGHLSQSPIGNLDPVDDRGSVGEGLSSAILFWGWSVGLSG